MWCHKPFWTRLPHSAPCLQGVRRHLWSRTNLSSPEDLSVPRVVKNPLGRIFYCVCSTVDPIFFLAELQQGVIPSGAGFGWVGVVGGGEGALPMLRHMLGMPEPAIWDRRGVWEMGPWCECECWHASVYIPALFCKSRPIFLS